MGFKIYPQPFENCLYDLFFVHEMKLTAGQPGLAAFARAKLSCPRPTMSYPPIAVDIGPGFDLSHA